MYLRPPMLAQRRVGTFDIVGRLGTLQDGESHREGGRLKRHRFVLWVATVAAIATRRVMEHKILFNNCFVPDSFTQCSDFLEKEIQ